MYFPILVLLQYGFNSKLSSMSGNYQKKIIKNFYLKMDGQTGLT